MRSNCALVTARTQLPAGSPGRCAGDAGAVGPVGSPHRPLTNITGVFGPMAPDAAEGAVGGAFAGFAPAGFAGVEAGAVCADSMTGMRKTTANVASLRSIGISCVKFKVVESAEAA